jgi:hypothetical protein
MDCGYALMVSIDECKHSLDSKVALSNLNKHIPPLLTFIIRIKTVLIPSSQLPACT